MSGIDVLLLATMFLSGPAAGVNNGAAADVPHCLVSLIDEAMVPARETGPLVAVLVKPGDLVQAGQPLAQIDDRQGHLDKVAAQMSRDAALARAADDVNVRLATAARDVAAAELQQQESIRQKSGGASLSEIRRLQLAKRQAELEIEKSRLDLKIAGMSAQAEDAAVKTAEGTIERCRIVSPIDGVVVVVNRHLGEWVSAGEPVVHVVRLDRLYVDGHLSAADCDPGEVADRPVTVEVELAHGRMARFQGRVVHVSPLLTAGSKHRVRAEVANRMEGGEWLLLPGAAAAMSLQLR